MKSISALRQYGFQYPNRKKEIIRPRKMKHRDLFHVSTLKKCWRPLNVFTSSLPTLSDIGASDPSCNFIEVKPSRFFDSEELHQIPHSCQRPKDHGRIA